MSGHIARDPVFASQLEGWQSRIEIELAARLPAADAHPSRLNQALRYSVLNGGKRVRPALVYATAKSLGLSESMVFSAACAVEFIHAYSLVHDDLPAMDNDDLRRGRPTCHKAFDEATAILVGDSCGTIRLPDSGQRPLDDPAVRLRLVELLAAGKTAWPAVRR